MAGVNGPCGERGDQEFPATPVRLLLSLGCLTWLTTQRATQRQIRAILLYKCTCTGSHTDNCFGFANGNYRYFRKVSHVCGFRVMKAILNQCHGFGH